MPMDRNNTLKYFYNNTNESLDKYLEVTNICLEIIYEKQENWATYLDDKWNATIPKMIDNSIILIVGKSLKKNSAQVA